MSRQQNCRADRLLVLHYCARRSFVVPFATTLFGAIFFAVEFAGPAARFPVGAALTIAFPAVTFSSHELLRWDWLTVVAFGTALPLPLIRNTARSLASASHAGARPRPLHVAPVSGSRYFGICGPRT